MIVIRRLVDRHRSYTGIFLRGVPPQIFPTSDQEHARILEIYKQDRRYPDVLNDFTEFGIGDSASSPAQQKTPPQRG
jgi:hypothetical protein